MSTGKLFFRKVCSGKSYYDFDSLFLNWKSSSRQLYMCINLQDVGPNNLHAHTRYLFKGFLEASEDVAQICFFRLKILRNV